MAKTSTAKAESTNQSKRIVPNVPAGYAEVADDITGYWDPDVYAMIHVIPKEAKVFDSNLDSTKPSILIFAKLVDSAILSTKDENGSKVKVEGKPGDTIGIWGKPGLRQKLMNMAGRDCFICVSGEKDIGKASPMITFSVRAKGTGNPLPLTEDRRDKSRHAETWWHNADGSSRANTEDDSEENIPI